MRMALNIYRYMYMCMYGFMLFYSHNKEPSQAQQNNTQQSYTSSILLQNMNKYAHAIRRLKRNENCELYTYIEDCVCWNSILR